MKMVMLVIILLLIINMNINTYILTSYLKLTLLNCHLKWRKKKYRVTFVNIVVRAYIVLNQCGTIFTRNKHQIKVISGQNCFHQRIFNTKT